MKTETGAPSRRLLGILCDAAIWTGLLGFASGCTHYTVLPGNSVQPQQWAQVRAWLNQPSEYPAGTIDVREAAVLVGQVLERNDRELVVSLFQVGSVDGTEYQAQGEEARVPIANVRRLEVKRFAPLPTTLIVGTIVAAIVVVPVSLFGDNSSPANGDNGDGGTPTFPRRTP